MKKPEKLPDVNSALHWSSFSPNFIVFLRYSLSKALFSRISIACYRPYEMLIYDFSGGGASTSFTTKSRNPPGSFSRPSELLYLTCSQHQTLAF